MDLLRLRFEGAEAQVARHGAELQALRLGGHDLLWHGGALWPKHAPLLFPIVGGLRDDTYEHAGSHHRLPKHGFARVTDFAWTRASDAACALALEDSPATRSDYPFAFRLEVAYTLAPRALRMDLQLRNPGNTPLPASLGLHPAFRWPLAPNTDKCAHRLVFDAAEPGPLRRLDAQGLLDPRPHPTPIQGRILDLHEGLFESDALMFLGLASRGLRYEAPGGPTLRLTWEGFPDLGVWTKPNSGPSFLCLEPWAGHASPSDWDGPFAQKPGVFHLAPGQTRTWSMTLRVD